MEGVSIEAHRGRFSGVAGAAGLDRAEICNLGCRQETGAAELWPRQALQPFPEVPLRRGVRHARAGRGIGARPAHHSRGDASSMKFKEDRPFATPETAERKLLELANAVEADHAGRLSIEIINRQFREAGGSYEEYGAAVKAAIAHGWITLHPSGGYLMFTQEGADLFA